MELTRDEYDRLSAVRPEMKAIIQNRAFSSLSPSLALLTDELGRKYFPLLCPTCGPGRFMIITRLYDMAGRDALLYGKEKDNV